jgi:hypothetical protein
MSSTYNKEAYRIKKQDLAPSLQKKLSELATKGQINTAGVLLYKEYEEIGDITFSATTETARPSSPVEKTNININTTSNLLEVYHDTKWNGRRTVFL